MAGIAELQRFTRAVDAAVDLDILSDTTSLEYGLGVLDLIANAFLDADDLDVHDKRNYVYAAVENVQRRRRGF